MKTLIKHIVSTKSVMDILYIPYITYPIVPTQNLCYRVSITLLIFLHILGIWLSITLFTSTLTSTFIKNIFHYFQAMRYVQKWYFSYLRIYILFRNCYVKLATEWKLHGVSTYLPDPEALCSKHIVMQKTCFHWVGVPYQEGELPSLFSGGG